MRPGKQLMTISPINSISAGGLGQYVLTAGNSSPLQQILQSLQSSLSSGDLGGAQSSFQTLQTFFQNSATANGGTVPSSSQLSTDMVALGNALSSGDVSSAQTAFFTVLADLRNTNLPSQIDEAGAASQSIQLVQELLSSVDSSSVSSVASTPTELANSALQSVYSTQGGLDVYA